MVLQSLYSCQLCCVQHISLPWVCLPLVSICPQQISHDWLWHLQHLSVSNMFQTSLLQLHTLASLVSMQGFLCHSPSLGGFLNHGGRFYNPFIPEVAFMILELETEAWSCPVLFAWTGIWLLPGITFEFYSKFSLLMFFRNRLFLRPILFTSHRMNWDGSSPEGTTPFILGLSLKLSSVWAQDLAPLLHFLVLVFHLKLYILLLVSPRVLFFKIVDQQKSYLL